MKRCITIVFFWTAFCSNAQQIPQYSQWFLHQFAINPAHAGIKSCVDIHTLYRSQWYDFQGAPNTGFLTFGVPLQVKRKYAFSARHGAGFKFETDQKLEAIDIKRMNKDLSIKKLKYDVF